MTTTTHRAARTYLLRLTVAIAAYAVLLPVCLGALEHTTRPVLRTVLVLLPVVPFAVIAWAVWRYLVSADELQRRMQLEALAFAFALGSVLTFAFGMLQVAGAPRVPWLLVWPVYAACWLLGRLVVWLRYR